HPPAQQPCRQERRAPPALAGGRATKPVPKRRNPWKQRPLREPRFLGSPVRRGFGRSAKHIPCEHGPRSSFASRQTGERLPGARTGGLLASMLATQRFTKHSQEEQICYQESIFP